jgi:hypothetical protein
MIEAKAINDLVVLANEWIEIATAQDLWDAIQKGGIDARVGMANTMPGLGCLSGPGTFEEELEKRDWAADAIGDREAWFLGSARAQLGARNEIKAEIAELFFDLGDWEWSPEPPRSGSA